MAQVYENVVFRNRVGTPTRFWVKESHSESVSAKMCHLSSIRKRRFSKQDWYSDDFGLRNSVIQKTFWRKCSTSIVEHVLTSNVSFRNKRLRVRAVPIDTSPWCPPVSKRRK